MKQITVTIDDATFNKMNNLATLREDNVETLANALMARGINDACYRHKRNVEKNLQDKMFNQELKARGLTIEQVLEKLAKEE